MPIRRFYHHHSFKLLKKLFGIIFIIAAAGFLFLAVAFVFFSRDLPNPSNLEDRTITESTKIYDRTGKVILYDIHGEERRTVIPFAEIPQTVKDATIVSEDRDFYKHSGIDFKAIIRAAWLNMTSDSLQGGSTLTQQFVKKSILSDERVYTRKIKEAILALELERRYSKDEILGFYLNQIPYGANAYGVEAAAQTYFSKSAKDLSLAESALLASLIKAPSYYSPYGSHKTELIARQKLVLKSMYDLNYITKKDYGKAIGTTLNFAKAKSSIQAPHFVFYIKEMLDEKYGEDYVSTAGLKITTTLDWDLQSIAEDVVAAGADNNDSKGAHNAALVSIDPKTGQILAMVGSRDYFKDSMPAGCDQGVNCEFEGNVNVATRMRQPGSAFKPFVYATAFKKGYTDKTMLFDVPTQFDTGCNSIGQPQSAGAKCYAPKNFDLRYRGPVTARQALSNSLNIPSVQMLYLAGVDDSINTAEDLGLTTLKDRSRFGLSLVLGGGEVKLLEMTSAFGVFATEGVRHPPTSILKIEDRKGNVLEEYKDDPVQVLDTEIARLISNILSDNVARTPVFGARSSLFFPDRPVAAKTGTTNEFRDGWTMGYTPSLVTGVWTGNNDNSPINQEPGVYTTAPIWHEFMSQAFAKLNLQAESFTAPNIKPAIKPILNGQYLINGQIHSTLYYVNKEDPQGAVPSNPYADPQFNNWEAAVRAWFGAQAQPAPLAPAVTPPTIPTQTQVPAVSP